MIEYLGVKEILYGLKKFAAAIVAVVVAAACVGVVVASGEEPGEATVTATRLYIVSADADKMAIGETHKTSDPFYAENVSLLLNDARAKEMVLEQLLTEYSEEQLTALTGRAFRSDASNYAVVDGLYTAEVVDESAVVKLTATTSDREFLMALMSCLDSVSMQMAEQVSGLGLCQPYGDVTITVNAPDGGGNPLASAVICGAVAFVLAAVCVFVYVIFDPAVSSKSDFEDYGLSVLDDAAQHKKEKDRFTAGAVQRAGGDESSEPVLLVCGVSGRRVSAAVAAVKEQLDRPVETVTGVAWSFEAMETARRHRVVILVERKGVTTHRALRATLATLQGCGVEPKGVLLV